MSRKRVKKIQDYDRGYRLLHLYVDFVLKQSYRSVVYAGKENIPQDGAIIFAPNHTNALMDALVLLTIDRKPKVFVARADIFKNRKLAKFFTFLKIMPIMRQRDGFNAVKKNHETIEKAVDVLKDKIPFCIFPEGTHQAKYSSLPLSKGIFRIAFQAKELMPDTPLYIVPVGLRYGNFFKFRSTVRVEFGKPINVGEYLEKHTELTPQEQMNGMREVLAERTHESTFFIPNDSEYDAVYEICNAAQPLEVEELKREKANRKKHRLNLQSMANNNTLKRIAALKESDPEKAARLLQLGEEASKLRESQGIAVESAAARKPFLSRIAEYTLLLLTLPYSVSASILASPILLACKFIFTKLKDPAFRNSVRFVFLLFVWPLLLLIYSIVALCLLPWQWAISVIVLMTPAPIVAHELMNTVCLAVSDIKLLREKKLAKIYSKIRDMVM